jgi:hypothetical protein
MWSQALAAPEPGLPAYGPGRFDSPLPRTYQARGPATADSHEVSGRTGRGRVIHPYSSATGPRPPTKSSKSFASRKFR